MGSSPPRGSKRTPARHARENHGADAAVPLKAPTTPLTACARRVHCVCLRARSTWYEEYAERRKYIRAVKRLANRPLSMAFNSWVEMREQGLFLRKLAKRACNRDLNKGWNSWLEYLDDLDEQARQRRVMDSVVRRYLNKDISRCLNQWTFLWRERQRHLMNMRKMGADGGVGKAWRQWRSVADTHTWLKGCVGRLAKNGISKAFNRWLECLDEAAAMRKFAK